jgi:1-deoxy-D-xylulose-5-phosphate reductoisomerase
MDALKPEQAAPRPASARPSPHKIRLAVLGSTGSIGTQALDVARRFPDKLEVVGLAAGRNLKQFTEQLAEFRPRFVSFSQAGALPSGDYRFLSLEEMAAHPEVDVVLIATPGIAARPAVLSAASAGKVIALANKESLVSAGALILAETRRTGARIYPVDSEHSAVWQCLAGEPTRPSRLILTASGGPFRNYTPAELREVTAAQALHHPSWQMGPKVTVDSATLLNKGLEVIEAHFLFDMPYEAIEVVLQPQSVIHSLVEFPDGAVKAQLSPPDMRLPIQYALSYPARWTNEALPRLDFLKLKQIDFALPDMERFPCLRLAIEAGRKGGTYPAALCAADEEAVRLFLEGRIKFTDIPVLLEDVLAHHEDTPKPQMPDIQQAEDRARAALAGAIQQERMRC